jgi:hypothetical protein
MRNSVAGLTLWIIRPILPTAWYASIRRRLIKQRLVYVPDRYHAVPIPGAGVHTVAASQVTYFARPGMVSAAAPR